MVIRKRFRLEKDQNPFSAYSVLRFPDENTKMKKEKEGKNLSIGEEIHVPPLPTCLARQAPGSSSIESKNSSSSFTLVKDNRGGRPYLQVSYSKVGPSFSLSKSVSAIEALWRAKFVLRQHTVGWRPTPGRRVHGLSA